jgi:hypothetical protein
MALTLVECDIGDKCHHAREYGLSDEEWDKIGPHVLIELKRLNSTVGSLGEKLSSIHRDDITPLRIEIAMLKVKCGAWGLLGGAIPVIIALLVKHYSA